MTKKLSVAIGSLGTVGLTVARKLVSSDANLQLVAVSARDTARAQARLDALGCACAVVPLAELASRADVIIECAPAEHFRELAEPVIDAGKILIPISVAGLLDNLDLVDAAARSGARIMVPSGAILGLDAIRGAAEGTIEEVRMITRKPPGGLAGAPYLEQNGISVENLSEALKVFEGTAEEGARGFPANVNVAAAVGLAGIGPARTKLEIWADPAVTRNLHEIHVRADAANFRLNIENVPSEENPKTGKLVALSILATLRRMTSPLVGGT